MTDGDAHRLVEANGGLSNVVAGSRRLGREIVHEPKVSALLDAVRATVLEAMKPKRLSSRRKHHVDRYLFAQIAHLQTEQVRCLYRDSAHRVVADVVIAEGDAGHALVRPRDVIEHALRIGAVGFILAHNHPSGRLRPSRADLELTGLLANAAAALHLTFDDHLIVSRCGVLSMREAGLLG